MRTFRTFTSDEEIWNYWPRSAGPDAAEDGVDPCGSLCGDALAAAMPAGDRDCDARCRELIRAYNEATGGANTDTRGYHETITQASIRAARAFLVEAPTGPLFVTCNALMRSRLGDPEWLMEYWTRPRLFSVEARRAWLEPDLRELPF